MTKPNPFDYVRAITDKVSLSDISGYVPYLTNHSLSNNLDTVMLANEMNTHPNLPPVCQYDFLNGTIRKGKRWGKWNKPTEHPHLELVMAHFCYNKQKALQALTVLTQSDIKAIIESQDKGGTSK